VLGADLTVQEGRAEVQKSLEAALAGSPTLSLTTKSTMIVGDHAVTLGEYTVTSGTGTEASTMGGTYLVLLNNNNGRWEIAGNLNNLNAAPPPGFVQSSGKEAPPEKGEMKEFVAKFTQFYDASDWAGLAGMYTADAKVAFSQAPLIEGTAAIRERFEQRFGSNSSPKVEFARCRLSMNLDADWAVDSGWFTVKAAPASGPFTQDGMYMNLLQRQPDGSWKIHWSVVNGYPGRTRPSRPHEAAVMRDRAGWRATARCRSGLAGDGETTLEGSSVPPSSRHRVRALEELRGWRLRGWKPSAPSWQDPLAQHGVIRGGRGPRPRCCSRGLGVGA
jgi:ketosteroid isomerase-like protein